MPGTRSKRERLIESVTGSPADADEGWSELLRPRRSSDSLSEGTDSTAEGDRWRPERDSVEEPISPPEER